MDTLRTLLFKDKIEHTLECPVLSMHIPLYPHPMISMCYISESMNHFVKIADILNRIALCFLGELYQNWSTCHCKISLMHHFINKARDRGAFFGLRGPNAELSIGDGENGWGNSNRN